MMDVGEDNGTAKESSGEQVVAARLIAGPERHMQIWQGAG